MFWKKWKFVTSQKLSVKTNTGTLYWIVTLYERGSKRKFIIERVNDSTDYCFREELYKMTNYWTDCVVPWLNGADVNEIKPVVKAKHLQVQKGFVEVHIKTTRKSLQQNIKRLQEMSSTCEIFGFYEYNNEDHLVAHMPDERSLLTMIKTTFGSDLIIK